MSKPYMYLQNIRYWGRHFGTAPSQPVRRPTDQFLVGQRLTHDNVPGIVLSTSDAAPPLPPGTLLFKVQTYDSDTFDLEEFELHPLLDSPPSSYHPPPHPTPRSLFLFPHR